MAILLRFPRNFKILGKVKSNVAEDGSLSFRKDPTNPKDWISVAQMETLLKAKHGKLKPARAEKPNLIKEYTMVAIGIVLVIVFDAVFYR